MNNKYNIGNILNHALCVVTLVLIGLIFWQNIDSNSVADLNAQKINMESQTLQEPEIPENIDMHNFSVE
ncbi:MULTISPECIES: hypothetical protein [unclassified Dehalobacter]|uniref:hypothetical protein n=1 Tax=unclassified Dehalobacter TaxID=2635733 RepID=UPI0003A95245|nr:MULTISPECIES: hypothetical protein [unclassified Dehalobacter]RJE48950.1 hypothetical protein A7K50_07475 [Dehalobacter sp. MCB1]TCX50949.1 hypothetical protein C1I38_12140 [Dehalobacter sp. 12DCB1]TCX51661.1 hypothetical protein C1I36_04835 [Dehalobacter sp. 14DCB1]